MAAQPVMVVIDQHLRILYMLHLCSCDRAAQDNFGDAAILNYIDGILNPSRVNTNRGKGKKTSEFRGKVQLQRPTGYTS
jgi:hypothetical protein